MSEEASMKEAMRGFTDDLIQAKEHAEMIEAANHRWIEEHGSNPDAEALVEHARARHSAFFDAINDAQHYFGEWLTEPSESFSRLGDSG